MGYKALGNGVLVDPTSADARIMDLKYPTNKGAEKRYIKVFKNLDSSPLTSDNKSGIRMAKLDPESDEFDEGLLDTMAVGIGALVRKNVEEKIGVCYSREQAQELVNYASPESMRDSLEKSRFFVVGVKNGEKEGKLFGAGMISVLAERSYAGLPQED
jgi:hypothetical protein